MSGRTALKSMQRKKPPTFAGDGHVAFAGRSGAAAYAIEGDPGALRFGAARLRGSIALDPELATLAFKAGEGVLRLADGTPLRIVMVGHTAGSRDVYIELRV